MAVGVDEGWEPEVREGCSPDVRVLSRFVVVVGVERRYLLKRNEEEDDGVLQSTKHHS